MSENLKQQVRQKVLELLPRAIAQASESYHDFAAVSADTNNAKSFSAHHTACKSALSQREALIKLSEWLDNHPSGSSLDKQKNPSSKASPETALEQLINTAQARLEHLIAQDTTSQEIPDERIDINKMNQKNKTE